MDTENRIAVQVTSTSTGDKVKHTINEFVKGKRCEDYDRLLIYIITEKLKKYSDAIFSVACDNELEFSEKDILDYMEQIKCSNIDVSLLQGKTEHKCDVPNFGTSSFLKIYLYIYLVWYICFSPLLKAVQR